MGRSLPVILALSLLPLACAVHVNSGGGDQPKPDAQAADSNTDPDGQADADPTDPTAEAGEAPGRAPTEPAGLPDCPADPGEDSYCTEDGKLAGQWVMADMVKIPPSADTIFEASHDDERQPSLTIAVDGDELYIRHVTCGSCARIMGSGFRGSLSSMSEAQIAAMQLELGLAADADVMTSTDRWRSYATDAGTDTLTELSRQSDG